MPFHHFKQTYRDLQRVRLILNTLIKYGFGYLIERLNLQGYVPLGKRIFRTHEKEDSPKNIAERFRLVLEELGPTFIKFGQLLSLGRVFYLKSLSLSCKGFRIESLLFLLS